MKTRKLGDQREPSWELRIHEAARKELLDLDDADYARVDEHLRRLAQDPVRPRPGMDVKKLKDVPEGGLYRLRVGGRRAIYAVVMPDRVVTVLVVEDREPGYARMVRRAAARLG